MTAFKKVLLTMVLTGLGGAVHADIVGGQAHVDSGAVRVGPSDFREQNMAGIGVDGLLRGRFAPASHFARDRYKNSAGVYQTSGRRAVQDGAPGRGPADHSKIGVWSFAKVGSQDVWFGEWDAESATGAIGTKTAGTHTTWYVGENGDVARTLPTAPVSYTVRSINNYTGAALPTSTLTANFTTGTAGSVGDIAFSEGTIRTVGSDVQLAALGVNVASSGGMAGTLDGKFFGTGASAVAGLVKFADRTRDTAFGGSKNP
ncbi:Slam-dependent surface lipoprotein [Paracandidimonas lactea]|uniref:Slam-dependent surface lipoprotein n=1 Tax=Paracandidimonas lactea TaxID=2895524 RepID=UPI001F331EB8|nr:Slam-dependent surface lipoprotein [Paracandidimonas lactea]